MPENAAFVRIENNWLAAPEYRVAPVESCCWCGGDICTGEQYLTLPEEGPVCMDCLEETSAQEFAAAVLGLRLETADNY